MPPDNVGDRDGEARATLTRLLADHGRGAAMCGSGFSMHLPMVLIALFRMGASPARLEAVAAASTRIPDVRAAASRPIDVACWERELGKRDAFVPYRVLFTEELARAPVAAVLSRFLPQLLEGLAGAGFHALIRLSYGLDLGARDEIAAGLACLASAFEPLGGADMRGDASSRSIQEALGAAEALGTVAKAPSGRILDAIHSGMRTPAYTAGLAIDEGQLSLRTLAGAALQTYVARPSIYTVHLVTAAHALKVVDDHYAIDRGVLRIFWQCVLAMHVAVGAAARSGVVEGAKASDDWSALLGAAVGEMDDHAIKLTYSCSVLARVFDDDRFRFAAARMLRGRQASAVRAH
jgi:hypothetical protein